MTQVVSGFSRTDGTVDIERDRVLVLKCQGGDAAAFAELYSRYSDRLYRFCYRRLNDHQEAEDVAQEAFVKAWRALDRFTGERRFYPWLTVIAANVCTDVLRRRTRTTPTTDVDLVASRARVPGTLESAEERVDRVADGALVNQAFGRLNVRHRHVLELREKSEWTYQQIAEHEGVDVSTIETLLWRARQALKREYAALNDTRVSLGAAALVALGAIRRFGAVATRRAGLLRPGGMGVREAVAALAITSVVAGAAALPATSHASPSRVSAGVTRTVRPTGGAGFARPHGVTTPLSPPAAAPSASVEPPARGVRPVAGAGGGPALHGTADVAAPGLTRGGSAGTPAAGVPSLELPAVPAPALPAPALPAPALAPLPVTLPPPLANVGTGTTQLLGGVSQALPQVGSAAAPVVSSATSAVTGAAQQVVSGLPGLGGLGLGGSGGTSGTAGGSSGGGLLGLP